MHEPSAVHTICGEKLPSTIYSHRSRSRPFLFPSDVFNVAIFRDSAKLSPIGRHRKLQHLHVDGLLTIVDSRASPETRSCRGDAESEITSTRCVRCDFVNNTRDPGQEFPACAEAILRTTTLLSGTFVSKKSSHRSSKLWDRGYPELSLMRSISSETDTEGLNSE